MPGNLTIFSDSSFASFSFKVAILCPKFEFMAVIASTVFLISAA